MDFLTIFLIAIGLSFDSSAVSASIGMAHQKINFFNAVKIAFSLSVFQALMPVLGWFLGSEVKDYFHHLDHWIAFGLLLILGLKMIWDSIRSGNGKVGFNPFKIWVLLGISVATSIDAFVVGLSIGVIGAKIIETIIIIGIVTFITSMLGMLFGKTAGNKFGKTMEIIGGIILILIGIKILIYN